MQEYLNLVKRRHQRYGVLAIKRELAPIDGVSIRANPDWLMQALDVAVDYAAQATEGLDEHRLIVRTEQVNDMARLMLINNGMAIPRDERRLLFEQPLTPKRGEPGAGLGLLMANLFIATIYQGSVQFEDLPEGDTALVFSFPVEA